jgi:hypothetical protein
MSILTIRASRTSNKAITLLGLLLIVYVCEVTADDTDITTKGLLDELVYGT